MTKIIDIQLALEQANGSEELAKDLFSMLINDLPVLSENLTHAFNVNDEQALWNHAHKIYGSTAYCGVPQLRNAAHELEHSIKTNSTDIENSIQQVIHAIEQLMKLAESELANNWSTV